MLGIVIGVASVIAMLAIGEGSKQSIRTEMSSLGTNMIIIVPAFRAARGVNIGASGSNALKYSDVVDLRNDAVNLSAVSPEVRAAAQVIFGNENTQTTIYGVSEEYFTIRKLEIKSGRIFSANEVRAMSKVCLLGQTVVENCSGKAPT
jgi:putative ABC transport system permease protein